MSQQVPTTMYNLLGSAFQKHEALTAEDERRENWYESWMVPSRDAYGEYHHLRMLHDGSKASCDCPEFVRQAVCIHAIMAPVLITARHAKRYAEWATADLRNRYRQLGLLMYRLEWNCGGDCDPWKLEWLAVHELLRERGAS